MMSSNTPFLNFLLNLCLVLLSSCSNNCQVNGFDENGDLLSDRYICENGIVFQVNSQTPFTGSFEVYRDNGSLDRIPNFKEGILIYSLLPHHYFTVQKLLKMLEDVYI